MKSGTNTWRITDTGYFFDHSGSYRITLTPAGGASVVKVKRPALLDGETVIAEDKPDAVFGVNKLAVEAILGCSSWKSDRSYGFLAEIETIDGPTVPGNLPSNYG